MNRGKPLGLPDGSVRAVLAMTALIISGVAVLLKVELPEWFIGLVSLIVGGYFAMRAPVTK